MDPAEKKRIDRAWQESKDWITEFDGTPDLALLVDIPWEALLPGLKTLAAQSLDFRITAIPAAHQDAPEFVSLEALPAELALLQEGKLAELSVNYAIEQEAFALDIHLIIHLVSPEKAALELDWWNDQVFSEETDNPAQFAALMAYFLELKRLFASPHLFLSPAGGLDPDAGTDDWVEV